MKLVKFVVLGFVLSFVACLPVKGPSASLMDNKPVITIGSKAKVAKDHIVYIPAGRKFPITFAVKGSVFSKTVSATIMVSFKRNIYLYRRWASLDGKNWIHSHKLLKVRPSGGFDKSGGKVELKLDFAR